MPTGEVIEILFILAIVVAVALGAKYLLANRNETIKKQNAKV